MNPFLPLFVLFIAIPLLEIWVLIQVGGLIGALPTIALVVATALLGAWLLRQQGLSTLQRAQRAMAHGEPPAIEIMEGMLLFFAAALLLTPGFLTDTIGFALLLPPLRRRLIVAGLQRGVVIQNVHRRPAEGGPAASEPRHGRTIEGEYQRKDE